MEDIERVKCPVCDGNPRRWLPEIECRQCCVPLESYEECTNCVDGYVDAE